MSDWAWIVSYLAVAAFCFGVAMAVLEHEGKPQLAVVMLASLLWPLTLIAAIAFGLVKKLER